MSYEYEYNDWAWEQYAADEGYRLMIEEALAQIPVDNISWYLGTFGDAIQARVENRLSEAEKLITVSYYGPAIVSAVTALELIIRYFVLRPLVQGTFLSEQWAELLTVRIISGRTAGYRKLLPKVVKEWNIDLTDIKLPDGKKLWKSIISEIWPSRNSFVHKGSSITQEKAKLAVECGRSLMNDLVKPIAHKFGLSWPESGAWHKVIQGVGGANHGTYYTPANPFKD